MRVPYMLVATVLIAAASNVFAQDESRARNRGAVQRWPTQGQEQGRQQAQAQPQAGPRAAVPRESRGGSQERPGVQAFRPSAQRDDRRSSTTWQDNRVYQPNVQQPVVRQPIVRQPSVVLEAQDSRRRGGGDSGQRRAEPRGSRPRGDNPQTGVAVPRGSRQDPRSGGRAVYGRPRGGTYNNYYYSSYPRRYYPYTYGSRYGYGAFGLGYFYYDPYRWQGNSWGYYGGSSYPYLGYGNGYDIGHLRLDVRPRDAEVYVDGYYAGTVDDFDGRFQGLALESGGYSVEIAAPGYEPLTFDVRITPGQTTRYRGELLPRP